MATCRSLSTVLLFIMNNSCGRDNSHFNGIFTELSRANNVDCIYCRKNGQRQSRLSNCLIDGKVFNGLGYLEINYDMHLFLI